MSDLHSESIQENSNLCINLYTSDTLHPDPGIALLVSKLVIYIWHTRSASEVLAVAISCIARVLCGSGVDHVARVSGQTRLWYGNVSHVSSAFNDYVR